MKVKVDLKLVSGYLNGLFEAKYSQMKKYHDKARIIMTRFKSLNVQAVKRKLNARVDTLAKGAAYGEYTKKEKLSIEKYASEKPAEKVISKVNMIDALDDQINEEC